MGPLATHDGPGSWTDVAVAGYGQLGSIGVVMWGTAVHGTWCGTRTWPTACQRCGADVFFFSCNCGSKVFFESLGDPWPVHDCDASWERELVRRVAPDGSLRVDVAEGVTAVSPSEWSIEELPDLGGEVSRASWSHPIVAMDPPPGCSEEVTGIVRGVVTWVDPYRKLRVPQTTVGAAALGPLSGQPVGRLTVHAPSPEEDDLLESFTAWIPSVMLADLRQAITVTAVLEAVEVLGVDCVWWCRELVLHG